MSGLAVAVATVIIGTVGSLQAMRDGGRPVVVGLFVLVAALAAVGVRAGARAVLSLGRSGSTGRGRAILGMVVAVASIAVLADLIFSADPAVRAPGNGPILVAGPIEVTDLLNGDCLTELPATPYDDPTTSTSVVPCDEPHVAEVVAVLGVHTDDAQMITRCEEATEGNGRIGEVHVLAPTQQVRATYGVGQLLCLQG